MERKCKRQAIFVPDETYVKVTLLQAMILNDGKHFTKGEIITRLFNHDPIIMVYYNKLKE